jgi:hypothetical protein
MVPIQAIASTPSAPRPTKREESWHPLWHITCCEEVRDVRHLQSLLDICGRNVASAEILRGLSSLSVTCTDDMSQSHVPTINHQLMMINSGVSKCSCRATALRLMRAGTASVTYNTTHKSTGCATVRLLCRSTQSHSSMLLHPQAVTM